MKNVYSILVLVSAAFCSVTCDDNYEQLCEGGKDVPCLKKFFSEHGEGKVVDNPTESAVYTQKLPIFLPILNITVVTTENYVSQLNGEIIEAYINKETGEVVLSVDFKGLYIHAPNTVFAISRDGKEPLVFTDFVNCTYPAQLTATLKTYDGIVTKQSLEEGEYSAYFANSNADIVLGPKFTQSQDPVVLNVLQGLISDMGRALQEIFRTKASFYFINYLQNIISDYEMNPVLDEYDLTVLRKGNNIETGDFSTFWDLCFPANDMDECVRDFFEDHGSCKVMRNSDSSPVYRERFVAYAPWLNVSAITTDAYISNLNGYIKEFYINNATGHLVMNTVFENIELKSGQTYIVMNRNGQEPKTISDETLCYYSPSITLVVDISNGLTPAAMQNAYFSAYFPEANNIIRLGPAFTTSDDEQMQEVVKQAHNNPTEIAQELFQTEAYSMMMAYIQKYICDFGLPISIQ